MKYRVLFVCTNNGVQSPMAEALLNSIDSTHFEPTSAGLEAGELHPNTIAAMKEIGIDLAAKATKTIQDVKHLSFDLVITLSSRARAECPGLGDAEIIHWQFDDPVDSNGTRQSRWFASLRDQISQRLRLFALVQVRFTPVDSLAHRVGA